MNLKNYPVVIIGEDHYNTLGLVRSLGEDSFNVNLILIGNDRPNRCFSSASCYVEKVFSSDISRLEELLSNLEWHQKPVLFPSSDIVAEWLDANFDILKYKYIIPHIDNDFSLHDAMNKDAMHRKAVEFGFTAPKTWIVKKNKSLPDDISFPCLIKATDSSLGIKDLQIYNDRSQLNEAVAEMHINSDVIIESYISKKREFIFLGWSHNGKVCIPCIMEKLCEYPAHFGNTVIGSVSADLNRYFDIVNLKDFIASYDFSGLFSVEFMLADDNVYFLEINFRNDGNGYFPGFGGCNIATGYVRAAVANDFSMCDKTIGSPFRILRETSMIKYALKTDYPLSHFLTDWKSADVYQYWNSKDKKPVWRYIRNNVLKFFHL